MSESLDEQYLTWLYARIGSVQETRPSKTYWKLLRTLFTKEFTWFVPNDDNRVDDGRYLRFEFLDEMGIMDVDEDWISMGCSVLEMIYAVCKHLSFEADGSVARWFWELMHNLNLSGYSDRNFNGRQVEQIIDTLVWRHYQSDGRGGLFPLRNPQVDQREVEIWYQMSAYLLEGR